MMRQPRTLISLEEAYMRRLIHVTGITAIEARELVEQFGFDMASLLREARHLTKSVR